MATDAIQEKYSVKNLLFYRAIPNYVLPENPDGHKVYSCKDCGDRFLLESSYQYHIQRKSVQISYKCRHCSPRIIFYNRCNLLSHIRSHTFKTATINVSDLKIDPLPLRFFKTIKKADFPSANINPTKKTKPKQNNVCFDCKIDLPTDGPIYKERASHYMEYTNKVYSCPVCLFNLPTICALKAHLRIHIKFPPFYCSECGVHLSNKSVIYPYNHSCEGFNMMRATTRQICPVENCNYFHPSEFKNHMREKHLKKIFSCPLCVVASFNESTLQKHINMAHDQQHFVAVLIFYQCEMCPGRLVMLSHVESHLNNHKIEQYIHPCWICNVTFQFIPDLIDHHLQRHDQSKELKHCLMTLGDTEKVYRVIKRCDQCKRNFTYKCHYEDISILPIACPYKCTPASKSVLHVDNLIQNNETKIKCPVCKTEIEENWIKIKKHFAIHHKEHRCVDAVIKLPIVSSKNLLKFGKNKRNKGIKRNIENRVKAKKKGTRQTDDNKNMTASLVKRNDLLQYKCVKCADVFEAKEILEVHIASKHRDPCMAYQCLECGDCFIVKPSFSIHLLFHGISDVDEYINQKNCFNQDALKKNAENIVEEPVDENQCRICRETFDNADDLNKHFRVHGMAFLMDNNFSSNKSVSTGNSNT